MRLRIAVPLVALTMAIAMVALSTPARAERGAWDITLLGGASIPSGDFADENKLDGQTGPQAGLEIAYHVSESFAIGVDGTYSKNTHGAEGSVEDLGGGITLTANKDRFLTTQFGVVGHYLFSTAGKFKPFAAVGLGMYNLKEDYEYTLDDGVTQTVYTDEDDVAAGYFEQPGSKFGWRLGLGGAYMTSPKFGIGLDVNYNSVSMDKDKFGVSTVPSIGVRGRLTYHMAK